MILILLFRLNNLNTKCTSGADSGSRGWVTRLWDIVQSIISLVARRTDLLQNPELNAGRFEYRAFHPIKVSAFSFAYKTLS